MRNYGEFFKDTVQRTERRIEKSVCSLTIDEDYHPERTDHDRNPPGNYAGQFSRDKTFTIIFTVFFAMILQCHPAQCSNLSIYPSKIEGVLIQEPIRRPLQVKQQVSGVKQNFGGAPLCLSKSGDIGVCMFLKSCLDLRGTLHGTCAKSFFLASCCVLPNSNTSSASNNGGEMSTLKPNFFQEVIMKEMGGSEAFSLKPTLKYTVSSTKRWTPKIPNTKIPTKTIYKGYTVPDWYRYKSSTRPLTTPLFRTSISLTTRTTSRTTRKPGQFGSGPINNEATAWFRPTSPTTHSPHAIGTSRSPTSIRTKWWTSNPQPVQPGSFNSNKPVTPLPDVVLIMPDGVISGSSSFSSLNTQSNGQQSAPIPPSVLTDQSQQSTKWSHGGSMVSANSNGGGSYVFNINMQLDVPKNSQQQSASFGVIDGSLSKPELHIVETKVLPSKNVTWTVATATNPIINGNVVPTPNDAMFVGTNVDNFLIWPNLGPGQITPSSVQEFLAETASTVTTVLSTTTTSTTSTTTSPTTSTTESTTTTTTPTTTPTTTTTTTPTTTTTTTTTPTITRTSTTTPTTTTTTTTTPTTTRTSTTTPTTTPTTTTPTTTPTTTRTSTTPTTTPTTTTTTATTTTTTTTTPATTTTTEESTTVNVPTTEIPTTKIWTRWVAPQRFTLPPAITTSSTQPSSIADASGQIAITLSEICGITPLLWKRIVGGTDARLGQFPWQVSLRRIVGFISSHRCGATLVHPRWILTAAHCASDIPTEKMVVRIGEYDFSDANAVYPHIDMRVAERIIHEKFNFLTFENDLALLRLAEPVNLAPHIIPACIAPYKNYTGSMGTISGWGRLSQGGALPPALHYVQVPFISKTECESWFDGGDRHQDVESCFICAGYKGGGKDACQGDSGGPVVQQVDGRWSLVGVISWGIGCADANLPGVSTLIPLFADWIQRHSNGDVYMPDFYLNKYGVPPTLASLSALATSSKITNQAQIIL